MVKARWILAAGIMGIAAIAGGAMAQTPKRGGTVVFSQEGEPPSYDCHGSVSSNVLAFVAPHYSALLRYDQDKYPGIIGDLAESWTISLDGLTYTFKLRPNVRFHDGSPLTAADVKASLDRIRNPPPGVASAWKIDFSDVASIDAIDTLTVAIQLSQRNAAMLTVLANPFTCIYSARRLAESQTFPATNVMGSGPFVFGEYVKGQSWTGKRFDGYFLPGQPYLDGFKHVILSPNAAVVAMAGGQIDGIQRVLAPQEAATIVASRGDRVKIYQTVLSTLVHISFNTKRKPFDDVRVRRALSLAMDRKAGLEPMTKISSYVAYGGLMRPGDPMASTPDELAKVEGFGDINAARTEARRLLAEAGQSNLKFKLLNRQQANPWGVIGIFAINEWRQIGVTVEQTALETAPYLAAAAAGEFDAMVDSNNSPSDDPSNVLIKYVPGSGTNNTGVTLDPMLSELFDKQKGTLDTAERRRLTLAFQDRVLSQAYIAPVFWAGWITAMASDIHGWKPTPSFFSGRALIDMWRE